MLILIEEYQYDVADVKHVLHGIDALENVEGKVSIHYVGYFYNTLLRDCVFILPKVLLKDVDKQELVFGKYKPEAIANLDEVNPLDAIERNFLYKFAVWVYRAIVVYKNDKRNYSDIVYYSHIAQVGKGQRRLSNTYLDILLSLIQFNRNNQSFFFFVIKNLHSQLNKINWQRTIATQNAIIQDDRPIYLNPVNKKRQINFDEELLVIYFSILNYIGDTYGFPKEIACQFQLITGKRFETYLNGFGKTRLRQIKYKYFSDKALQLWQLCYAFFDEARQVYISTDQREYLLVKNFYIVFEAIIDELIGDNPLPDGMQKKQEDGKIVDHLFTAHSLIEGEAQSTYYIGDSKYYKMGHELGSESIYKQYTYARNVIQWNLDIFNDSCYIAGTQIRCLHLHGNIIFGLLIIARLRHNRWYKRLAESCRRLSGNPQYTETVNAIARYLIFKIGITQSQQLNGITAHWSIFILRVVTENVNAIRGCIRVKVRRRTKFFNGTHHAVALNTTKFPFLDLNATLYFFPVMAPGNSAAVQYNRHFLTFFHVGCSRDNLRCRP